MDTESASGVQAISSVLEIDQVSHPSLDMATVPLNLALLNEDTKSFNFVDSPLPDEEKKRKRRKKCRGKARKNRPGNRIRRFQNLRYRGRNRNHISRSMLGAPFLCNDMVMAKDGWVFDTSSGKIEFKPDIARNQTEQNTTTFNEIGGHRSRYVPISPVSELKSQCQECICTLPLQDQTLVNDMPLIDQNQNIIQYGGELVDCDDHHSVFEVPTLEGNYDISSELQNEFIDSMYDDDLTDFNFHLENFEDDTERYLRESLMELSRDKLEAEYHSTMRRYRRFQREAFCGKHEAGKTTWQEARGSEDHMFYSLHLDGRTEDFKI